MPRPLSKLLAILLSALGFASASAGATAPLPAPSALVVKPGDVVVQHADAGWSTFVILEVDAWPDGSSTAHCLSYEPVPTKPTLESLAHAPVRGWHPPIAAASFGTGWERIGRRAVTGDERAGFLDYLRLIDFRHYVKVSGVDVEALVAEANAHYKTAYALGDAGQRLEAIAAYSAAIDRFPLFHEAIDNRGFTYMELGRDAEALSDFEASLRVKPDGVAAFFSRGECLMRLGRLEEAERVFEAGEEKFPEQRAQFAEFLGRVRGMRRAS